MLSIYLYYINLMYFMASICNMFMCHNLICWVYFYVTLACDTVHPYERFCDELVYD